MELSSDSAPGEIDLVLFEVGGRTFGADVADVSRVAHLEPGLARVERLGLPRKGRRALVVRGGASDCQVPIDRLVGFRRVNTQVLRSLPAWARGLTEPSVVGFLIEEQELLILIDLETLVVEARAGIEH